VIVVQVESTTTDDSLGDRDMSPCALLTSDAGIDDPVNDTGLGSHRGDMQMSNVLICFLGMIVKESGESS
jgi:hypothetical protein